MLAYSLNAWLNRAIVDNYIESADRLFPEQTKIKTPEFSYAQELLNVPVPFENRLLFLSDYSRFNSVPVGLLEIAKELEITKRQAQIILDDIAPEQTEKSTSDKAQYVAGTLEVVEEELRWMLEYDQLDNYLSAKSIGTHLHRKPDWVTHRTNEFGIFPRKMMMPSKRNGMGFEKTTIVPLRHWILHHPPAGDWVSQKELIDGTGKHQDWIRPRMLDLGFESKSRVAYGHNVPTPHYKPDALPVLQALIESQPEPAGDWMTVGTMFVLIGRDRKWVLKRIAQYRDVAELRIDDFGREAVHFPPFVFEMLVALNEAGD